MPREPQMRHSPEFDLIGAIRDRLAPSGRSSAELVIGVGDDAAVTVPAGATATSVDAIVDGVHFQRRWCQPEAIGEKALNAALSDLAAMGAAPGEAYVWLGRPPDLDQAEMLRICDGIAAAADAAGVAVLGGDLTRSPVLALSVTVVGHAASATELVGRDRAEPGQALCVTGEIGGSAAGLMLLEDQKLRATVGPLAEALIERQLRPRPRLAEGRALGAAGAAAMIDLSDGLGADADQLAAASGVAVEIEAERLPLADGLREVAAAAGRDPDRLALGGEDYELLCALPRARVEEARQALAALGTRLTEVGSVTSGRGTRIRLPGGRSLPAAGHDHFSR